MRIKACACAHAHLCSSVLHTFVCAGSNARTDIHIRMHVCAETRADTEHDFAVDQALEPLSAVARVFYTCRFWVPAMIVLGKALELLGPLRSRG